MHKKIRKKKQLMNIHLVITLRSHIFTCKRLNVKKMNRYFVPETVMVYRTAEKKMNFFNFSLSFHTELHTRFRVFVFLNS